MQIAAGEAAKAHDLLAAIRILKSLDAESRSVTPEERTLLRRFPGFGPVALSIFPDPVTGAYKSEKWRELGEDLRSLLSAEEYASAKRTTFNAFYTSPTVISAIHEAIGRLGVPSNAKALEPGCGIGNFMSLAPPGMHFLGVELDSLSGRIARSLHPEHDIRIESFRDTMLPEGSVDAVVGNVPFSDLKLEYRGQKLSLHDFFLAKSVDALRPQGVLAVVTTHFTLDKVNAAIREYLGSKTDFIAAIRLPSSAFKREGTSVVTDILFLRKRATGEPANHADLEWASVAPLAIEDMEVSVNRYFLRNPHMVLGTWTKTDTLYGEGYSVRGNGDLETQLRAAVKQLPKFTPFQALPIEEKSSPRLARPPPEQPICEGSFFIDDDRVICQIVEGQVHPVVCGGKTLCASGTMTGKRLAALTRLRDLARRVLASQNNGLSEGARDADRCADDIS